MKYRTNYTKLAAFLTFDMHIHVFDMDYWGYCVKSKGKRVPIYEPFIFISPKLSYKYKYFTLLHEMGHIFYFNSKDKMMWTKRDRNETEANMFAMSMLKTDVEKEQFKKFYGKAGIYNDNRCASWREIINEWADKDEIPESK